MFVVQLRRLLILLIGCVTFCAPVWAGGPGPPTAVPQTVQTFVNTTISISLTGIDCCLGNQVDFSLVSGPSNGTLLGLPQLGPSPVTVMYTPALNYIGPDFFQFQVQDKFNYSFALLPGDVNINVVAVPEPSAYVLMLVGLVVVWWAARRRRDGGAIA